MKKIIRKLSGLIFILFVITILGIYSYVQDNPSMLVSASTLSRNENWLGNKKK